MEFGPFHHYEVVLPEGAQTVRLRVIATVNSATEFVAIDNLSVTVVPEPASIAMLGRLGQNAAAAYSELEAAGLKARIATLEGELSRAAPEPRRRKR